MNKKEFEELEEIERERALGQLAMIVRSHDFKVEGVLSVFPQFGQSRSESTGSETTKKYDPIFNPQ